MKQIIKIALLVFAPISTFSLVAIWTVASTFVLPFISRRFDGFSQEVRIRVAVREIINNQTIKADILSHSAIMDSYMINWSEWDKYDLNDREVNGNFPADTKVGNQMIGIGGRSGYKVVTNKSILSFNRIKNDSFDPFGADINITLLASALMSWIIFTLLLGKFIIKMSTGSESFQSGNQIRGRF